MDEKGLIKKIFYKDDFRGTITKDGRTYKKYRKVQRFPFLNARFAWFLFTLLMVFVTIIIFHRLKHIEFADEVIFY